MQLFLVTYEISLQLFVRLLRLFVTIICTFVTIICKLAITSIKLYDFSYECGIYCKKQPKSGHYCLWYCLLQAFAIVCDFLLCNNALCFRVSLLPELQIVCRQQRDYLVQNLKGILDPREAEDVPFNNFLLFTLELKLFTFVFSFQILKVLNQFPIMNVRLSVSGWWSGETKVKSCRITLTGK